MERISQPRASRRWVWGTLLSALTLLLLAAALIYSVDPFQHYRAMTHMPPKVDGQLQAYYNIGIARNYEYDTLLLGSSMTENTSPRHVEELFGGQVVNLPFSGGSLPPYARMMKAAFDSRPMRRVMIILDSFAIAGEPETSSMHIPTYLYDDSPFTDVYYLLSWDSIEKVIELFLYNAREDTPETLDLDRLYYWGDLVNFGYRQTLLSYAFFDVPEQPPLETEGKVEQMRANINLYLRPFIEGYPDTEFIFYFPPYSAVQWYSERKYGMLERQLFYRTYYAQELLPYDNVKLFDFQAHEEWVNDLDNYKDISHYRPEINELMTEAMARGDFGVTELAQIEVNNRRIREIAKDFEPPTPEYMQELREMTFE